MKAYERASLEIIYFDGNDVICTSLGQIDSNLMQTTLAEQDNIG